MSEILVAIIPASVGALSAISVALVSKYTKPLTPSQRFKEYAETAQVIHSLTSVQPASTTVTKTTVGTEEKETISVTNSEQKDIEQGLQNTQRDLYYQLETQIKNEILQRDFFGVVVGLCGLTFGMTLMILSPWIIESVGEQMKGFPLFRIIFSVSVMASLMSTVLLLGSLKKKNRNPNPEAAGVNGVSVSHEKGTADSGKQKRGLVRQGTQDGGPKKTLRERCSWLILLWKFDASNAHVGLFLLMGFGIFLFTPSP